MRKTSASSTCIFMKCSTGEGNSSNLILHFVVSLRPTFSQRHVTTQGRSPQKRVHSPINYLNAALYVWCIIKCNHRTVNHATNTKKKSVCVCLFNNQSNENKHFTQHYFQKKKKVFESILCRGSYNKTGCYIVSISLQLKPFFHHNNFMVHFVG